MLSYVHFGSSLGIFTYSWRTMGLLKQTLSKLVLCTFLLFIVGCLKELVVYTKVFRTEGDVSLLFPPWVLTHCGGSPHFLEQNSDSYPHLLVGDDNHLLLLHSLDFPLKAGIED